MPAKFIPRLDVLPQPQRQLWPELKAVPSQFALYGGTALALYFGHRESLDFDFFGTLPIDPDALLAGLPFLKGAQVVNRALNTLDVTVQRDGPVKVSFFGLPSLPRLRPPRVCPDNQIRVASLLDLAGTNISVVQKRSELKDYRDVAAMIRDGRVNLAKALSAAGALYGASFVPQISLKALSYFGDGDLGLLSQEDRMTILTAIQRVNLARLPSVVSGNLQRVAT